MHNCGHNLQNVIQLITFFINDVVDFSSLTEKNQSLTPSSDTFNLRDAFNFVQ